MHSPGGREVSSDENGEEAEVGAEIDERAIPSDQGTDRRKRRALVLTRGEDGHRNVAVRRIEPKPAALEGELALVGISDRYQPESAQEQIDLHEAAPDCQIDRGMSHDEPAHGRACPEVGGAEPRGQCTHAHAVSHANRV